MSKTPVLEVYGLLISSLGIDERQPGINPDVPASQKTPLR